MNKDEFNSFGIIKQVSVINDLISKHGSFRKACECLGIAKSTLFDRLKKNNYIFSPTGKIFIPVVEDSLVVENFPVDGKKDSPVNIINYNSLDNCLSHIRTKLIFITKDFIEVGNILSYIQENKLFKQSSYKNLLELCSAEFGLSKTVVYNLISVSRKFSVDGALKEEYKDFKFSQLVEMLSLPDEQVAKLSKDMETKDIRAVKKSSSKSENKNEVFENIDIAKNQVSVEDVLNSENNDTVLFDINSKDFLISNNLYILSDRQVKILLDIQGTMFSSYLSSRKDWDDKKKDSILNEICEIRKILERED